MNWLLLFAFLGLIFQAVSPLAVIQDMLILLAAVLLVLAVSGRKPWA